MFEISSKFEKHIPVIIKGMAAVDLLAQATGLSKQQVKNVMQKGAVWVTKGNKTQRLRRAKKILNVGETLHIYYNKMVLDRVPDEPTLVVDLGHYSVWNKPYGMLSQGSKWGDHCTITRWAEQHLQPQRNSFVVHRLDRAANGLIIIAHEKKAAAALSKLFQTRDIEKRYRIWVHGQFDMSQSDNEPIRVAAAIDGRNAVSYFNLQEYDTNNNRSLLEVTIETGRKHQIRRHILELGYSVVGDRLYGQASDTENLQLMAYYLAFECPYSRSQKVFNLLSNS